MTQKSPKAHRITVQRTAQFYSLGELGATTKNIWLVFHGYGQLAEFFIKKFKVFSDRGDYVIAPEGFSKYYLQNASGRVGASWMTKHHREDEINDQKVYLDNLYNQLTSNGIGSDCTINVIGFSQGVSTIFRWLNGNSTVHVNRLVFWSGRLPDEVVKEELNSLDNYYVYGDEDPYLTAELKENQQQWIRKNLQNMKVDEFKGKHEISEGQLKEYINRSNW